MACFELKNLCFAYPGAAHNTIEKLSLQVEEGEFLTLIGASGSGKSTLLRCLKPALRPHGVYRGEISFFGEAIDRLPARRQASEIGFVLQDPDSQIVTDKVWHELAFGLESLGEEPTVIRRRVAEMAAFFGIEDWFYQDTTTLSGGQKQLLNLAAVMTLQPRVLLLDEPTAQLDPIASGEFLRALSRICRELGTTVILSEHHLEEVLPLSDRVLALLPQGAVCGSPTSICKQLKGSPLYLSIPTPARLCGKLRISEAKQWLQERTEPLQPLPPAVYRRSSETAIEVKHLYFRYEKQGAELLRDLSCSFGKGQLTAILGGNGAGKSTLLSLLAGIKTPQRGKVQWHGRLAYLPQDPRMLFVCDSLAEDFQEVNGEYQEIAELCKLTHLLQRHPFDLSGGEQQRAALAKLLLTKPAILLLDEPTKGMDAPFKQDFARILSHLIAQGASVIMVSHDMEFCAEYADRCLLLFDGGIAAEGDPSNFFSGNRFYTTSANRIIRQYRPEIVTCTQLLAACGIVEASIAEPPHPTFPPSAPMQAPSASAALPRWRKGLSLLFFLLSLVLGVHILTEWKLSFLSDELSYALLAGCLLLSVFFLSRRAKASPIPWKLLLYFALCLPLTLCLAIRFRQQYVWISLLLLLEVMLPFFLRFERRRPGARELVLLALLSALCVAGRAAFYALPQCKPTLALVIIAGICLGREGGFLVGALSMLLSNLLFGQGPWTLWQMFAMGVVGFTAGALSRHGLLRSSRLSLCVFGAAATVLLYGVLMNLSSALTWHSGDLSWSIVLAYCASGFPMDVMHGASTVGFLWLLGRPMLKKMQRIQQKYDIME